jgi:hypothetical protein
MHRAMPLSITPRLRSAPATEQHVPSFCERCVAWQWRRGGVQCLRLVDRKRLSREPRLVHFETHSSEEASVCCDLIASSEKKNVALSGTRAHEAKSSAADSASTNYSSPHHRTHGNYRLPRNVRGDTVPKHAGELGRG